jgi:hypothetical protein
MSVGFIGQFARLIGETTSASVASVASGRSTVQGLATQTLN